MLRTLIERFENVVDLPIEIDEICAALVAMGAQDSIFTCPEQMDTDKLLGTFTQYTIRPGVYAAPELVTLIVYPENADIPTQRAVCAKELVHVCDRQSRKVHDLEFLREIAEKIVGPFQSSLSDPLSDLVASMDVLAQYQAMNILFPKAARTLAREKLESDQTTLLEVSEWVCAPTSMVEQMLDPEWESVADRLVDI